MNFARVLLEQHMQILRPLDSRFDFYRSVYQFS